MAFDGFLGYINETDPVSTDIRNCVDSFLQLPKKDQNLYFSMYENDTDYCESKDEFGKIVPYKMAPWIKTAVVYIKGLDKDGCTEYALRKSIENINSIKISGKKVESIVVDEDFNRALYNDGTIQDMATGEEITNDNFMTILTKKRKELEAQYPDKVNKDLITPEDEANKPKDNGEYNVEMHPSNFPVDIKKEIQNDRDKAKEKAAEDTTPAVSTEEEFYDKEDSFDNSKAEFAKSMIRSIIISPKVSFRTKEQLDHILNSYTVTDGTYDFETGDLVICTKNNINLSVPLIYNVEKKEEVKPVDTPISWDELFMETAKLWARRSKDPSTKVGAVIVKDYHIISTGYNGMPYVDPEVTDGKNNDEVYPWERSDNPEESKYSYVVHAELNAILSAKSSKESLEGATLYSTLCCCNECSKAIIQSKISRVVYLNDRDDDIFKIGRKMLKNAGIKLEHLTI